MVGERSNRLLLVDVQLVAEEINTVRQFGEIPLVISTFMFKRNFGVDAKKRRKKCDEEESEGVIGGLGMNKGISLAETDLVEPLSNRIRY